MSVKLIGYKMKLRLIACIGAFVIAMSAMATGQSGDIITIDEEQWGLLGKPIGRDSVLYHRLLEVLPKDRSWTTAKIGRAHV